MLEENKNLKNSLKDSSSVPVPYESGGLRSKSFNGYSKTNKLVTALYMVTDIMDKEEPLRNKLRTLGLDILSDMKLASDSVGSILSLLDIASALKMISEMNCNILKKEFLELKQFMQESDVKSNPMWLEEFLMEPSASSLQGEGRGEMDFKNHPIAPSQKGIPLFHQEDKNHIGHIGVQKGSTLLKALRDVKVSDRSAAPNFNILKKQRRDLILKTIKNKNDGASIKDIAFALRDLGGEWGEKTLQRELVSMTHDGVLEKTGEKRWSRYSLKH